MEENCEMIWKIWKKSTLKYELIWKIWKKSKLKCEMIWKIWKKIVKRFEKNGRK
jgi:hypothetical protein